MCDIVYVRCVRERDRDRDRDRWVDYTPYNPSRSKRLHYSPSVFTLLYFIVPATKHHIT
jgi:hypothetical protein